MPRAVQADALAKTILSATASLIEDEGVDALTMRAVATRAGYSPTAIYLVYKNKEELLVHTLAYAYESFLMSLLPVDGDEEFPSRLRRINVAFVRWGVTNPNMFRLLNASVRRSVEVPGLGDTALRIWNEGRDLVERELRQGRITSSLDPAMFAQLAWAGLHGIVWLTISDLLFDMRDEGEQTARVERAVALAEAFSSMLLAGTTEPSA